MTPSFSIRPAQPSDREQWQPLWEAYLVFYESVLPPESTDRLWKRIQDPNHGIQCLVAESTEEPEILLGMVQFFPHDHTWEETQVCYLQDLYVNEAIRGGGIGAALIQAVEDTAKDNDWKFVYWQTKNDNTRARGLYDKLTGGANGFITYRLGSGTATPLK